MLQIPTSESAWALVGKAFAAVGGLGVAGVVVRWIATRGGDFLSLSWKHRFDRQLAEIQARLSERHEVLLSAITSTSSTYLAAQERRLLAVEELWSSVLELRHFVGPKIAFYALMHPSEYPQITVNARFAALHPKSVDEYMRSVPATDMLEHRRPFLGERAWVLFWVYRAVCLRLGFRVAEGHEKGGISPWDRQFNGKDDAILGLLRQVLSEDEILTARGRVFGGPQFVLELLEQRLLSECDKRVSGLAGAEVSVGEGKRLAETLLAAQTAISGNAAQEAKP